MRKALEVGLAAGLVFSLAACDRDNGVYITDGSIVTAPGDTVTMVFLAAFTRCAGVQ